MLFTSGKLQAFEQMMRETPRPPLQAHHKSIPKKSTSPSSAKLEKEKPNEDQRPFA